jgi:protein O-GlcNAc transferase
MSLDRYTEWLSRGRTHQSAGRVIDALPCYRRALREVPAGVDARFHLGEIAWHMRDQDNAIAAWRAACAISPAYRPAWHALAEALAATNDFAASLDAVNHVLALAPDEPRALALQRLLTAAEGNVSDATLGHALGTVSWPLPLLAHVAAKLEAAGRLHGLGGTRMALANAALTAVVLRGAEDALRRIANAFARAGDLAAATACADYYADACRALYRASVPSLWALRTAGDALRLGLLVAPRAESEAASFRDALAAQGLHDIAFVVLVAPDATWIDGIAPPTAATAPQATLALPLAGDAAARAIAALDLDILVDLAGIRGSSGPLLALHPARVLWRVEATGVPSARVLADRVFTAADGVMPPDFVHALHAQQAALAGMPRSAMDATTLSTRWEEAVRAHQQGNLAAAGEGYARVLDVQPNHAPALYLQGVVARSEGDTSRARERFRAAVDVAPDYVDARVALVTALVDAGDVQPAMAIARAGLERDPSSATLRRALGQSALACGDAEAAFAAFDESLRRDPSDADAHYNHGVALQRLRQPAEAARAYQRALTLRPDLYAADFNLGVIFEQQGNAAAAIAAFSNVLARAPRHVAAYKALAEVLLASGRIDAWFDNFERFETQCPGHLALAVHALEVCAYRGDFARLGRYLDGLRHGRFTAERADETLDALQQLLYLLHFFDVEPELIARYATTHDTLARTVYGEPWPRRADRRPGKIRIGYLSGDFRNHVMGKMMFEAVVRHDRARFEVAGYATTDARDAWTQRFESAFSRFVPLADISDAEAARRIAADDLDVLVDLSTHTKGARPGILALKPSRVQITHVASAGTLAMSAIDFKLTDQQADAADASTPTGPLLAMEGCVYPYRHVAAAAAPLATRDGLRIAPDAVVIGAFSTPLKLSQRCLALWRDVFSRVPNAVLAFSPVHPALRRVFERLADLAGIAPHRIVFVPQGRDDAENQARYRVIDFVLDPMPYGGVNGTLEALDMGVPVVTLVGRRHAERTSYSILANLGVTATVAQTGGDYVDIAVRLATDRAFMRDVRARIAAGLASSALTDMEGHARRLEAAYAKALEVLAPEALAEAHV